MFRLDRYQAQPSAPIRLVVAGELSQAACDAVFAAVEQAQHGGATVELDLHDVTRVDRAVVASLALLCAKGVSICRCPAYLERWYREERSAADEEAPAERCRPTCLE